MREAKVAIHPESATHRAGHVFGLAAGRLAWVLLLPDYRGAACDRSQGADPDGNEPAIGEKR
jgi:hypothetical protein